MEVKILAFGIARDILGAPEIELATEAKLTVGELLKLLKTRYPAFRELTSLAIAVNTEYAEDDRQIQTGDEVVIIPPVAGG